MMLSGYAPGAEAVRVVGVIAQDLKLKATMKPGSFFWVLDPVMGDNGKIYVAEDCVPAYKDLVKHADLILPNQYEAEYVSPALPIVEARSTNTIDRWLSGVKIVDMESLTQAIAALHTTYRVPHILITSVSLPTPGATPSLSVIGSTMTSAGSPRIFKVQVPKIDCYFSGTGDMFAALILVRLREAVSKTPGLGQTAAWLSPDDVASVELPLAIATEKAAASMQEVLIKTKKSRDEELEAFQSKVGGRYPGLHDDKKSHRIITKASEVRLVRNMECLRHPQMEFRAEKVDFESN